MKSFVDLPPRWMPVSPHCPLPNPRSPSLFQWQELSEHFRAHPPAGRLHRGIHRRVQSWRTAAAQRALPLSPGELAAHPPLSAHAAGEEGKWSKREVCEEGEVEGSLQAHCSIGGTDVD